MQSGKSRSNVDRALATRASLITSARRLFADRGYFETGTPDLVAAAGVTRGALYHHFTDKKALFRAVVEAEAATVAEAIEKASSDLEATPKAALLAGSRAFLDEMAMPGRARILLVDAAAVLGRKDLDAIDAEHGGRTLRAGLSAAMAAGILRPLPLEAAAQLLSCAFDRAALAIAEGAPRHEWEEVLEALIDGLSH